MSILLSRLSPDNTVVPRPRTQTLSLTVRALTFITCPMQHPTIYYQLPIKLTQHKERAEIMHQLSLII